MRILSITYISVIIFVLDEYIITYIFRKNNDNYCFCIFVDFLLLKLNLYILWNIINNSPQYTN